MLSVSIISGSFPSFIRRGVGAGAGVEAFGFGFRFAVRNFSGSGSNSNNNKNKNMTTNSRSSQQHHLKSESKSGRGVDKIQQIIHTHAHSHADGWEKCWAEGVTPWDLGKPTPIIQHLAHSHALPNGRALVPGCGSGYDVVAMASPDRYVVGLETSQIAIAKALQLSSSSPNANYFTFIREDFFTWRPTYLFDLIFDYTFFCAIEPEMRSAWGEQINNLLKPDGELITLMFPISDHAGGPPYKVSISDYEEVLCPFGFEAMSISDNNLAVEPRKGREKLGRWKRLPSQSSL